MRKKPVRRGRRNGNGGRSDPAFQSHLDTPPEEFPHCFTGGQVVWKIGVEENTAHV